MMGNLLDNAIRHAQCNGRVTAASNGPTNTSSFESPMMDPALRQPIKNRIFERFVRVGTSDGAGLGLPSVDRGGSWRQAAAREVRPNCPTFVVTLPADSTGLKCAHDAVVWRI